MDNVIENRKEIFLELIASWEGRKILHEDYFGMMLSISQLASLLDISESELKAKFNSVNTLASEGFELREGFFAAKVDDGYQVKAQLNGRQEISICLTEAEAIDFFLNIFPSTEPLTDSEKIIQDIFIDFSLRKFSHYIQDPIFFSSVKDRGEYVGIEEDRLRKVVKSRYVKTPPPYSIELRDDRGMIEILDFDTEDEFVAYHLR